MTQQLLLFFAALSLSFTVVCGQMFGSSAAASSSSSSSGLPSPDSAHSDDKTAAIIICSQQHCGTLQQRGSRWQRADALSSSSLCRCCLLFFSRCAAILGFVLALWLLYRLLVRYHPGCLRALFPAAEMELQRGASELYAEEDVQRQRGGRAAQRRSSSDKRSQQAQPDSPQHAASPSAGQEWTVHDGALLVNDGDGMELSSPV